MLSLSIPHKFLKKSHLSFLSKTTLAQKVKPKVVVVGAGWAGFRVAQDLDKTKYDVAVISPRNHFLFTPLLPSTTVGTLEFRAIQEPVRTIPHVDYHQASVVNIDLDNQLLIGHLKPILPFL
jgi:NADH:ubiquinone reductase (non-electrogenic)